MRNKANWKALIVTALAVGILPAVLAGTACAKKPAGQSRVSAPARRVLYWYDPMKPEVHFDHPGKSPFMDMELVARYAEEEPSAGAGSDAPSRRARRPAGTCRLSVTRPDGQRAVTRSAFSRSPRPK